MLNMDNFITVVPAIPNGIDCINNATRPVVARVTTEGCFECVSHRPGNTGYPRIRVQGRLWLLHRYLWTQAHGTIPPGMLVCHRCDNRMCLNVEHYFLGSIADNNRDMYEKGRHHRKTQKEIDEFVQRMKLLPPKRGSANGNSKLNEEQVKEIRKLFPSIRVAELARQFGVSSKLITLIVKKEVWKHV